MTIAARARLPAIPKGSQSRYTATEAPPRQRHRDTIMVSKLLHCANALACVLLPSLVQGQGNIIIVDAANGGGTHFLDIPPAVAAAQPGDTIRVRAGTYNGFTLNIGISVVAEGNVFFGGLFQWPTINVAVSRQDRSQRSAA
jgi:hypothetical protein